jgi:hypothetical protein
VAITLSKLESISRNAAPEFRAYQRRVLESFAAYIREELREQHVKGRSIYGKRYPQPKRGGAPMLDTGTLMTSYEVTVSGDTILIDNTAFYSEPLQNRDGEHVHKPTGGSASMPDRWKRKLAQIKETEGRRMLRQLVGA